MAIGNDVRINDDVLKFYFCCAHVVVVVNKDRRGMENGLRGDGVRLFYT
jgi:hypothetical protein